MEHQGTLPARPTACVCVCGGGEVTLLTLTNTLALPGEEYFQSTWL